MLKPTPTPTPPPLDEFKPQPGSLTLRLLELLARNKDDDYSVRELVVKFDETTSAVNTALQQALAIKLVKLDRLSGLYSAGPELAPWMTKRKGTTAAVATAAATPAHTKARAPRAARLPPLDTAALVIKTNVPIPPAAFGKSPIYAAVWARMKPGDMVELPRRQAASLVAWVKKQKADKGKAAPAAAVRTLSADVAGVWRTA